MLYTVVPLQRIYFDHNKKPEDQLKNTKEEELEYKEVMLSHGRIVAVRDGENYVIQRINSTDMSDFLNVDYSPGKFVD